MRKLGTFLISIVSVCLMASSYTVHAADKIVRVAFLPEMYGFYEISKSGSYSGYNYEYLMNVAQHTGWTYDFVVIEEGSVSASLAKAEKMLVDGEIDLVGPYSGVSAGIDDIELGERNYGVYRYNYYSATHNAAISEDNYFLKDVLSVALVEYYEDLNQQFFHLMEYRGYELDIIYVQSHAETIDLLLNEKVDTIINLDMSSHSEYLNYLTTVQRIPFYFASTKGNSELLAELDEAIGKIEMLEPAIHHRLLETYFGVSYQGDFIATEQEQQLLAELDLFKVGFLSDVPPYQYTTAEGENSGISIDLLERLEQILNIPFEVCWYNTLEELSVAIASAEIDMIGTLSNNYTLSTSLGVTLTMPYTSAGVYWLSNVNETGSSPAMYHYVSDDIPFYARNELTMVWDIKNALDVINKSATLTVVCDPNITDYYLSLYQYDNIQVKAVSDVLNELTLGVGGHIDASLISMLNRAIGYLKTSDLDEIVFKHTNVSPEYTMLDILKENASKIYSVVLLVAVIVIVLVLNTLRKFKELSRRDSLTKLYNSGYFHDYVSNTMTRLTTGVLILIDIDYFKDVNDTYGHQVGDEIIKILARNLERVYQIRSTVGRLGGDEFAVFLEGEYDLSLLEQNAQELLASMAINTVDVPTTLSIGGFIFENITTYDKLFKDADKVLYEVKDEGRNGMKFVKRVEEIEPRITFDHTLTHEIFMRKANQFMKNSTPETNHALLSLRLDYVDKIEESSRLEFAKELSERLKTLIRKYDFICCRNSSEYLIFLESCGSELFVHECKQRIITALDQEYSSLPEHVKIKGDITFALYPEQGKTYKELFDIIQK